jgi:uncharacterized protein YegP (UPF0339 family)
LAHSLIWIVGIVVVSVNSRWEPNVATPRFELYDKAGWHWRLVDVNGRIVASSFRYASKTNARRAAQKAKDAAAVADIVDALPAIDVTAVAGSAFGETMNVTISGLG